MAAQTIKRQMQFENEERQFVKGYRGGCHCGKVRFEFWTERGPASFQPRICTCDFCRGHGSAAIADPSGKLALHLTPDHKPYRFGLQMTDFHVCNTCGVFVAASWQDMSKKFLSVVNVNALDDADEFTGDRTTVSFDGEDREARAARRRMNWTPSILV